MLKRDRALGCLLGGAVGDALGASVEFLSLDAIRGRFGAEGIRDFAPAYGRLGAITDDTQMTLFTAEGCLRAETRSRVRGICDVRSVLYHAYLRWLNTQGISGERDDPCTESPGWLIGVEALHSTRAPGNTCVSALASGCMGSVSDRINDSKGCGGVMRVAPVGLFDGDPFELGCDAAAITHGHPSGFLAAGCLALMIHEIARGVTLEQAVRDAIDRVMAEPGHQETSSALQRAVRLAEHPGDASAETVETLGAGWIAEEALAIAVYCGLVAGESFERGVVLAVNHSGDSDSTGAIAGNLLGTLLGPDKIPERWLSRLELREEISTLAADVALGFEESESWWERYPGC